MRNATPQRLHLQAEALEEFADHIRDTWGQAYSEEFFPNLKERLLEIDPHTRTIASASMGRHIVAAIERQLREWAQEKRRFFLRSTDE